MSGQLKKRLWKDKKAFFLIEGSLWSFLTFSFVSISGLALHHLFLIYPVFSFLWYLLSSEREKIIFSRSQICLISLCLWCVLTLLFTRVPVFSFFNYLSKTKYFLFAFFLPHFIIFYFSNLNLKVQKAKIEIFLKIFFICTSIATVTGLIALKTGFHPLRMRAACHASRACGMYGMYMDYGYGISFVVIIVLGLYLYRKEFKLDLPNWLVLGSLFINSLGMFFSFARGSWLGFLCALPFLFFRSYIKKIFKYLSFGLVLFSVCFFASEKFQNLFLAKNRFDSMRIRLGQYHAALNAAKDHPVWGLGYKNFQNYSSVLKYEYDLHFAHLGGHAHNNFFEFLGSTGIIGFLLFLFFNIFWCIEVLGIKGKAGHLFLGIFVLYLISGMFQYTLGNAANSFLILFLYGLSQVFYFSGRENSLKT